MLHRFTLIFSLIVSFGMAQIGALTHEISHHTNPAAQNQQLDFNKIPAKIVKTTKRNTTKFAKNA